MLTKSQEIFWQLKYFEASEILRFLFRIFPALSYNRIDRRYLLLLVAFLVVWLLFVTLSHFFMSVRFCFCSLYNHYIKKKKEKTRKDNCECNLILCLWICLPVIIVCAGFYKSVCVSSSISSHLSVFNCPSVCLSTYQEFVCFTIVCVCVCV